MKMMEGMKEIMKMIKEVAKEFTITIMETSTMASGKMMQRMEKVDYISNCRNTLLC